MVKKMIVCVVGLFLFAYSGFVGAATLDFEDLYTGVLLYDELPTGYGGFNWSDSTGYITKNYTGLPGYENGTVGNVSIFSIGTQNIEMHSDFNFDFIGAYLNIHLNTPARSITIEGLLGGIVEYSETITIKDPYPLTWYDFNFENIDELRFDSEEYVVIDNFTFQESSIPEPSTLILMVISIIGLVGARIPNLKKI